MFEESFYLSDEKNVKKVLRLTGLAEDELESIVGRFKSDHWRWPNQMKGEVVVKLTGEVKIRHHFTKKVIWSGETA